MFTSDIVHDAGLAKIAACTTATLCSSQPANLAGIAALALGEYTLTSGDFTIANGDVSGRKITIATKTGNTADVTGVGTHWAFDDGTDLIVVRDVPGGGVGVTAGADFELTGGDVRESLDDVNEA